MSGFQDGSNNAARPPHPGAVTGEPGSPRQPTPPQQPLRHWPNWYPPMRNEGYYRRGAFQSPLANRTTAAGAPTQRRIPICYTCGVEGHYSPVCPNRQYSAQQVSSVPPSASVQNTPQPVHNPPQPVHNPPQPVHNPPQPVTAQLPPQPVTTEPQAVHEPSPQPPVTTFSGNPQVNSTPSLNQMPTVTGACFRCGEEGHFARYCPTRPAASLAYSRPIGPPWQWPHLHSGYNNNNSPYYNNHFYPPPPPQFYPHPWHQPPQCLPPQYPPQCPSPQQPLACPPQQQQQQASPSPPPILDCPVQESGQEVSTVELEEEEEEENKENLDPRALRDQALGLTPMPTLYPPAEEVAGVGRGRPVLKRREPVRPIGVVTGEPSAPPRRQLFPINRLDSSPSPQPGERGKKRPAPLEVIDESGGENEETTTTTGTTKKKKNPPAPSEKKKMAPTEKKKRQPLRPLSLSPESGAEEEEPTSTTSIRRKREAKLQRARERRDAADTSSQAVNGQVEDEGETDTELRPGQDAFLEARHKRFGSPSSMWPNFKPREHFELEELGTERIQGLPVTQRRFKIHIKSLHLETRTYDEICMKMTAILETSLRLLLTGEDPKMFGRVIALNQRLYTEGFSCHFVPLSELDLSTVLDKLMAALNSDENIKLGETVFELLTIPSPPEAVTQTREKWRKRRGCQRRGRRRNKRYFFRRNAQGRFGWTPGVKGRNVLDLSRWLEKRQSVHNPSKFLFSRKVRREFAAACGPLALIDGLFLAQHPNADKCLLSHWYRSELRFRLTRALARSVTRAGESALGPFDEDKIVEMTEVLTRQIPRTRFSVFTAPTRPIHVTGPEDGEEYEDTFVDILLFEGHVYVIKRLHCYLGGAAVCRDCHEPLNRAGQGHGCNAATCRACFNPRCVNEADLSDVRTRITCHCCLSLFKSHLCLTAHQAVGECKERKRCSDCMALHFTGHSHVCAPVKCGTCGLAKPAYHRCWVWPDTDDKAAGDAFKRSKEEEQEEQPPPAETTNQDEMLNVFTADFETEPGPEEDGRHVPILLSVFRIKDGEEDVREYLGKDCASQFIQDILETKRYHNAIIAMHNASRLLFKVLVMTC